MPALISLPLLPDNAEPVPLNPRRALQAIVYDWLRSADAGLAAQVHDQERGAKPYAISGLLRDANGPGYHWQLALLDDGLLPLVLPAIGQTGHLNLLRAQLRLVQEEIEVWAEPYGELEAEAETATRIDLRFESPTGFRAGELITLFPEPFKCWQSWLCRWNAFAPLASQINVVLLDAVMAHVAVSAYSLSTRPIRFEAEQRTEIGFTGQVSFAIVKAGQLPPLIVKQINALANYATFCGTGHATTRGLGQTRRV